MYNIHLITFANKEPYVSGQKKLDSTYKNGNILTHTKWNEDKIYSTKFYEQNKNIFIKYKTIGFGLFIWKPFIILEKINEIEWGEYIYYQDSSKYDFMGIQNDIQPVCEYMESNDIELLPGFMIDKTNKSLIKPECLEYMSCINNEDFLNKFHYQTSPMIFKKTPKTLKFIEEWLKYCMIPKCIIKNVSYHQCDQAILNILLYKYNWNGILFIEDKTESKKYSIYWEKLLEYIKNKSK